MKRRETTLTILFSDVALIILSYTKKTLRFLNLQNLQIPADKASKKGFRYYITLM